METLSLNYVDIYTLKILVPSLIIVLFVLFLTAFGIVKMRMLMNIDPSKVGYKEEGQYISSQGRKLAKQFAKAYAFTLIGISAGFVVAHEPSKEVISEAKIKEHIHPTGNVCLIGENCYGESVPVVLAAATEEHPGKAKFSTCASCHGADGAGAFGPALKGRDADYIIGRLTAYKNNETLGANSSIMWGQAGALTQDDMQQLADYISTLK